MTIIRTQAHVENRRTVALDKRPAWVRCFVDDAGRHIGIRMTWLNGPWACSPDEHFTDDLGRTFRRVSLSLIPPAFTMNNDMGEVETDPEKLSSLDRLMAAYQDSLSKS